MSLTCILGIACSLACLQGSTEPEKDALTQLQGTWVGVSGEEAGKKAPEPPKP